MAKYNKVFAALDGAATQEAVVRRALSIAHDNNAEVLFGHVLDSVRLETGAVGQSDLVALHKQHIEKALERQLNRARKDPNIPSVDIAVGMGSIGETLANELAKPFKPDLLICGARGLSNLKYAFVGSVSTYLVRHMDCDVLVVRPESIDEIEEEDYAQAGA